MISVATRESFEHAISRYHAARSRAARLLDVASFAASRPRLVRALAGYVRSLGGPAHRARAMHAYRLLRHLHNHHVYELELGASARRHLLMDQGPVQQLWAIALLSRPPDSALNSVIDAMAERLPSAVLWLEIDPAEALQRMRARLRARGTPDGDFEERADSLRPADFERGQAHFAQIAEALARRDVRVDRWSPDRARADVGPLARDLLGVARLA